MIYSIWSSKKSKRNSSPVYLSADSMRILTFILLSFLSFNLIADQFVVFEKNGYFGIKDEEGQVTVPAVYEKLGWSDGSSAVKNGVI